MTTPLLELLNGNFTQLAGSLKEGKVITVDKTASLPSVLELLSQHDIRSIPVVDSANNDKLLGVVDMLDIVTFVVRFAEESNNLPAGHRDFAWFSQQVVQSGQDVAQVAGISHKSQCIPVMSNASIFDIMQIMVNNHSQRVPVMGEDHKIQNFITQSAFIQFFAKHSDKLGGIENATLTQLGFKPKTVYCVKENGTAVDAFKLMSAHKITGVPIVDVGGEIITNVSSKELRHILTDPSFFDKLQTPAERFVSDLKTKTFLHKSETMYPKICCKFSNTFGEILHKLAATKIHRIYVVDEAEHPIGVISLDDIVSKVYEAATNKEVHLAANHPAESK